VNAKNGEIVDTRTFSTLPDKTNEISLAVASCMSDFFLFPHEKMWNSLIKQNPDIMFFLGDNVYAAVKDPIEPKEIWKRYVETRQKLEIFYADRLIPIFATWDDHDFGWDNGDKTYAYTKESTQIFRDFFPQDSIANILTPGPGVAQILDLYNQRFIFTDDRTFRDPVNGNSMWGMEQESWVKQLFLNANGPLWLISGSQVFGKYGSSESMENDFPQHLERLQSTFKSTTVPFFILSGDLHASEVMRLTPDLTGQETLEITSSSMHAYHSPFGDLKDNPRRVAGYDSDNFIILKLNPNQNRPKFSITSFDKENKITFQLSTAEVPGQ
jgi:phosphodiesterase/alkaline phosphatase D-like protein